MEASTSHLDPVEDEPLDDELDPPEEPVVIDGDGSPWGYLRDRQAATVRKDTEVFDLAGAKHIQIECRRLDEKEWKRFTKRLQKIGGSISTTEWITLLLKGTVSILVCRPEDDGEYKPLGGKGEPIAWDSRLAQGAGIEISENEIRKGRAILLAFWSGQADVPEDNLGPLISGTAGMYLSWLQGTKVNDDDDPDYVDEPEGIPGES